MSNSSFAKRSLAKAIRVIVQSGTLIAFSIPALGQTSSQDEAYAIEEIVVTAIRRSLEQALDIKRNSESVVDAISAEDVGKFPDENIAESLQRITGVQINRLRGEGQEVNIRGLPSQFNRVQLNGRTLPSALNNVDAGRGSNPSRNFDFTALPSEFIRTLEVHKTPTAQLEEGGLAGTIVIRTPRPFDFGERIVSGSVQSAWNSNSDEYAPRFSGLYSDIFADGKWGVTLGYAVSERQPETHELDNFGYNNTRTEGSGTSRLFPLDFNGNGVIEDDLVVGIPDLVFQNLYEETRKRSSAIAALQYQLNDNLQLHLDSFYTKLDIEATRFENLYIPRLTAGEINAEGIVLDEFDGEQRAVRYDAEGVDLRGGSRFEDRTGDILSVSIGADYSVGLWTIEAEASISDSEQLRSNLNLANFSLVQTAIDSTLSSDAFSIEHNSASEQERLNPDNFRIASLNGEFNRKSKDDIIDFRIDFDRELNGSLFNKIEFGARYSERQQFQDNRRLVVNASEFSELVGGLPESPAFGAGSVTAAPFLSQISPSNGDFLGAYSGNATFPSVWLGTYTRKLLEQFSDQQLIEAGSYTNDPSGIVDVEEDILSTYFEGNFSNELGTISGNVGVRVVRTEQISRGSEPDLTGITFQPEAGELTTIPILGGVEIERSYTDILPSANIRFNIDEDLVLRFSASRTMSRPPLVQVSPSASANGTAQTISQQNPDLDPFRANNFDMSVEWYFADLGLMSATYFYKDVRSLVTLETVARELQIETIFGDGTSTTGPATFQVTRPVNGGGVKVQGLELSYQQTLDFLPKPFNNLGVMGNYTYIDNSEPILLTGSSENNYNVGAFYETEKFGIRVSYSWRDNYLIDPIVAFGDGLEDQSRGVLDANFTYIVNDNIKIVLEGVNLTQTADRVRFTNSGLPSRFTDTGRRVLLGVNFQF